ncbi:CrcB family protein [Streptococcus porcorum]
MRLIFLSPLVGTVSYILAQTKITWLRTRLSMLFWNSSLAIVASACLVRGIIEVSGRSTTIDQPYWWVAAFFAALSLGVSVFSLPKKTQATSQ